MEFDNTNRGTLFVNDRKTTDKQPDYTGYIHFGTVKMKLAAWERTSKAGNTFLSLAISEYNQDNATQKSSEPEDKKFKDDEIPF